MSSGHSERPLIPDGEHDTDMVDGSLYRVVVVERDRLREALEQERTARHAVEAIKADELLRRRTNLEAQIEALKAEVAALSEGEKP